MVDQLSILFTYPLHHTKNAFLLASGRMGETASNKYHEVFELLTVLAHYTSSMWYWYHPIVLTLAG